MTATPRAGITAISIIYTLDGIEYLAGRASNGTVRVEALKAVLHGLYKSTAFEPCTTDTEPYRVGVWLLGQLP